MKSKMNSTEIQDISSVYGKDIEEKLTSMLSEELSKEIDRSILRTLGLEPDRWKRRKNSINKIFK